MTYDNAVTGQIIRELRRKRGLSQEVLSGLAGVARSHLAMIENGTKNANMDTLWRLAEALDMPLSTLVLQVEAGIKARENARKKTPSGAE